jgi:ATP-dependent DNA helicase RecQ
VNNYECLNSNNQSVIKFSKQFINQIESMNQKNYKLKKAKVNFIIYWLKENTETEVKIILPELCFERTETIN